MTTTDRPTRYEQAVIEPDPTVPAVHITRDFRATPEQLLRATAMPSSTGCSPGGDRSVGR